MKKILYFAAFALLLAVKPALAQEEDMGKANQKPQSVELRTAQTVKANYLLFLPEGYESSGTKKWPLMLFLHGAGERGTNLNKVAVHGPPKVVKKRPDFPFVVVSPQCPPGEVWNNDVLLALLDDVTDKLQVDPKRIYLTGLSMGGFATWSLGLNHPDRFAAIAPICGGGNSLSTLLVDPKKQSALKSLPVWAFHGGKDPVVQLDESERMVKGLKSIGNDAKLTVYPDAGHDSWTETYNNQELYDWFLQHERGASGRRKNSREN